MGIAGILKDLGINLLVSLSTDSSAAKGIASRRGLGKMRHVELSELWIQDRVAKGEVTIWKIPGLENSSDSLTKHSNAERIGQTLHFCSQTVEIGRHDIMPSV